MFTQLSKDKQSLIKGYLAKNDFIKAKKLYDAELIKLKQKLVLQSSAA